MQDSTAGSGPRDIQSRTSSWDETERNWTRLAEQLRAVSEEGRFDREPATPGYYDYAGSSSAPTEETASLPNPYLEDWSEEEAERTSTQPVGSVEVIPWRERDVEKPATSAARQGTPWKAILHEVLETIILTLLIYVLIRGLGQNFRIEGYSMEPNLHEGQFLIVSKAHYYFNDPQRGDIVVFEYPKGDPNGPEKDFIKRIIGLPGDTVECRPGEILVNGQVIAEPYGPNLSSYSCSPTTLGPDEYYVLGDNRNQSSDSHSWGALERKYIIGKALISYWPMDQWGPVPNYPIQAPEPVPPVAQSPTP